MKRRIALLALTIGATLTACSNDSPTNPNASIAGAYTLRTVNGTNLPYIVLQIGADKLEILNETITVSDAGTFTQQGTFRITESGVVTNEGYADSGIYTRTGTAVTFVFQSDGSSGTGTVSGDVITVGVGGFSYVYRK